MGPVFLLLFVAVLGYILYSWISRYIKNENSPVIATRAMLIDKHCDRQTMTDANGVVTTTKTYTLLYQLDTGSTLSLPVRSSIYRRAMEQEWGTLTFQGTRFLKFEGPSGILER